MEPRVATVSQRLTGQVLSRRYELYGVVGTGGMATVFRALDRRLQREVAVKVLHPHLASDPQVSARFQREAQYAARLSAHPHIVAIHDVGESAGLHYIVMELVPGQNLRALLEDGRPLNTARALEIGRQVAGALDWAHQHGIIHRDIKPENILISQGDAARVTDFGIAHAADSQRLTRTGLMVGTATYVSPEQAAGEPPGRASDIYSLAVVLYEMLVGRPPFRADTPLALALMHVREQPPPPDRVNPQLPPAVSSALLGALNKSPADRYTTASDMITALGRSLQEATVHAPLSEPRRPPESDDVPARGGVVRPLACAAVLGAALAALILWQAATRSNLQTEGIKPTATLTDARRAGGPSRLPTTHPTTVHAFAATTPTAVRTATVVARKAAAAPTATIFGSGIQNPASATPTSQKLPAPARATPILPSGRREHGSHGHTPVERSKHGKHRPKNHEVKDHGVKDGPHGHGSDQGDGGDG